jgi:hypothetical protein
VRLDDPLGKVFSVGHVLDFVVGQSDRALWACNLVPDLGVDLDFQVADVARTTDVCTVLMRGDLCLTWKLVEVFLGATDDASWLAALLLLWRFGLTFGGCCWLFGKPLQILGGSHCDDGVCRGERIGRVNELGNGMSE